MRRPRERVASALAEGTADGRDGTADATHRRAVAAWYLFDWAAQPFFTLVVTFLYGPYFASTLAANPVEGQALWGYAGAAAGFIVAVSGPLLGAFADRTQRRKGWILAFSAILVAGCLGLGLAVPGTGDAIAIALVAYVVATLGAELATVFTNAMMADLARPGRLGRLSGNGVAIGYFGGLLSLVLAIVLLRADEASGLTPLGVPPMFGLVPVEAASAAVGPLCAIWYLAFAWPLFVFVPERRPAQPSSRPLADGLADLRETLSHVRRVPILWRFLLASMLYRDGLTALATFGGIYAVGILGWSQTELGLFGILIILASVLSASLGGHLDDRSGPDGVVRIALLGLVATTLLVVSISADRVLFVIPSEDLRDGGLFSSTADLAMLAAATLIGLFFGPVHAASRSMLVRIAPADHMTALFGLYALAGKVTSFAGPLLVALATDLIDSQRAGAAVIPVFFVAGIVLLPRLSGKGKRNVNAERRQV